MAYGLHALCFVVYCDKACCDGASVVVCMCTCIHSVPCYAMLCYVLLHCAVHPHPHPYAITPLSITPYLPGAHKVHHPSAPNRFPLACPSRRHGAGPDLHAHPGRPGDAQVQAAVGGPRVQFRGQEVPVRVQDDQGGGAAVPGTAEHGTGTRDRAHHYVECCLSCSLPFSLPSSVVLSLLPRPSFSSSLPLPLHPTPPLPSHLYFPPPHLPHQRSPSHTLPSLPPPHSSLPRPRCPRPSSCPSPPSGTPPCTS